MVEAARAGGRAIPELWPLGTEALALAMEVSVLEAKRLGHRAVLRLSWQLLVASVALSTLLQVAVVPATLVGYLTAGATPVWLLGSFAMLSLLYRAEVSADPAEAAAEGSAERAPVSVAVAPSSAHAQHSGAEVVTKRAQAERVYAELSATGAPVSAGQLAAAAGLSASYARALVAQFQARPAAAIQGQRPLEVSVGQGQGGAGGLAMTGSFPAGPAARSGGELGVPAATPVGGGQDYRPAGAAGPDDPAAGGASEADRGR
jgi:hypothetical protein